MRSCQIGDLAQYNAIAILGSENNGDGTLVLGGGQCVGDGAANGQVCQADADCGDAAPCALEYNACPSAWTLNHFADGAPNPIIESVRLGVNHTEYPDSEPSEVYTQLTVVPCTENFETQQPTSVTLQFQTWNEFESQFSVSTTVTCWGNFVLSELGAPSLTFPGTVLPDPRGTMFLQTRIRSANGTASGFLMVAETLLTAKTSAPGVRLPARRRRTRSSKGSARRRTSSPSPRTSSYRDRPGEGERRDEDANGDMDSTGTGGGSRAAAVGSASGAGRRRHGSGRSAFDLPEDRREPHFI